MRVEIDRDKVPDGLGYSLLFEIEKALKCRCGKMLADCWLILCGGGYKRHLSVALIIPFPMKKAVPKNRLVIMLHQGARWLARQLQSGGTIQLTIDLLRQWRNKTI